MQSPRPAWRAMIVTALAGAFVVLPANVRADIFGGGGSKKKDCLLVFDAPVNLPAAKPKRVRCVDGDPSCDADATINGVCVFPVAVCANSTYEPSCSLVGLESSVIDHSADNGDPEFDPEYQALQSRIDGELELPTMTQDDCTGFTNVTVAINGPFPGKKCRKGKKRMRIDSESLPMSGKRIPDRDKLKMECRPDPDMCDPLTIFAGTFDRIQRQVFTPTCAVGGCHDSQSLQGNMTLEAGSAHGALVNVDPDNAVALGAGWKRVMTTGPTSGDPAASFLFHKLTGDLDAGMGARMPLDEKALSQDLIDIIMLWISGGAPATGWVAGTDQ